MKKELSSTEVHQKKKKKEQQLNSTDWLKPKKLRDRKREKKTKKKRVDSAEKPKIQAQ